MLKWYYYVLLSVVTLSALSMTWWSMFDLGVHTLSVPVLVAVLASVIFDLGGVYLILLSIDYAKTSDSGFWTELGSYAFLATSTYIVVQHGVLDNYPVAGVVMFAAAPIVLGIILKATLNYLTRQQRRATGRVTEKLPSVGWLTWVRFTPQSWKLMSVAMQGRLVNAADKLEIVHDKYGIFGQAETELVRVSATSETAVDKTENKDLGQLETKINSSQQLSQRVQPALTDSDNLSLPVWLPNEPTMTLGKLVRTALDNSVSDIETIYRYALTLKGQDVNKLSLSRTLAREKAKQ